jgi:amino-acid N-acetyltransferase
LPRQVSLHITDDGRGFDVAGAPGDRLGLNIMRERADAVGAFLEIKSTIGEGTEVCLRWQRPEASPGRAEAGPSIRPARPEDLSVVLDLLGRNGLPAAELAQHAENLLVATAADEVVGAAAVEHYGDVALLRSVVVQEGSRSEGLGTELALAALDLAASKGAHDVYLLTETAEEFFSRLGFRRMERELAPSAVRDSVEFRAACPETALLLHLNMATVGF